MGPGAEGVRAQRELRLVQLLALLLAGLIILTIVFGIWTATSVWSFPRFVLAIVFIVYLPGKLLLDICGVRVRPLEDLVLCLVLGLAASGILYWILAYLGLELVFPLIPLAAASACFYGRRKRWREIYRWHVSIDLSHLLLVAVIVLALVPLTILSMYYRNVDLLPASSMSFARRPFDVVQHLSFAYELTHSVPPEVPFFSGEPLKYHQGMDLLAAMLSRTASLSVLDLTVRFLPTLFAVTTVLAVFCFSRVWLNSHYAAVLVSFLVVFGEDLSFVPGLMLASQETWSAQFFGVPTIYSLYAMNPMLPALGALFSGLFCLSEYWTRGGRPWLVLTAGLLAVLAQYKVFATAHVVGAMVPAGLVYFLFFRSRKLLAVAALTLLLAAPLVAPSLLGGQAGSGIWTRVAPWPYVPEALEQIGLLDTGLGREIAGLFAGQGVTLLGLLTFFLIALPAYLLGSLGVRVAAVPALVRTLISPQPEGGVRFFLSLFCFLGPAATMILSVTPLGFPPASEYNNAVWFYVQSKYVIWLFVAELVLKLGPGKRRFWQGLLVAVIVGLSIPSSAQYFQSQAHHRLEALGEDELALTSFLGQRCPEGEVVLSRRTLAEPIVALTTCRVPILSPGTYTHLFVSRAALERREEDMASFWDAWREEELRSDILVRYEAAFVVIDKRSPDFTTLQPSWHTASGLTSTRRVRLAPCFENANYVVYETKCDDCDE